MAQLRTFPGWYLRAKTAFDVHSPLLYPFCTEVLDDNRRYYAFDEIEAVREHWLATLGDQLLDGFAGAGDTPPPRSLGQVLRQSASQPWKGRFLFRLALWWKPQHILEFGTNLGIGTAYLASADRRVPVRTVDSSTATQALARQLWKTLALNHVHPIQATFSDALPGLPLESMPRSLVYLDGDHHPARVEALLGHLQDRLPRPFLVILDDIRWSAPMLDGWKGWPDTYPEGAWIDLYQAGLWFADPSFREPVRLALIPRRFKPLRLGWI